MNPNWLLPIGITLGLTLIGLAGASKPLGQLDLWLDQQDSPLTAQANALAPIIDCLNQADVPLRQAHQAYQDQGAPRELAPAAYDISSPSGLDLETTYRSSCASRITDKLRALDPQSPLLAATERYLEVLGRFSTLTRDSRMQRMGFGRDLNEAQLDQLVSQLQSLTPQYLQAADAVRQLLLPLDIQPRAAQLQQLEQRLGRNAQWALLNYMIQARSTVDQLDSGLRQGSLTPAQLAEATRALRQAWDARQQFQRIGQPSKDIEEALYLWHLIEAPSQEYLTALEQLHQDWQQHAAPQRLSLDFLAVTRGYDKILWHYNQLARNQY
ncbi:DUF3829 domain-containing protein [Pseudomonas sp. NFXW11]|uniref:DUF3829 domain-containing protein n=1 Tax=Pseudomonas sp. NFXW11 TaxID=2819531 RepID=UPI003CE90E28